MPVAMPAAALATVIGYAAMFGTARQVDEGTAAHVWQLLMAGQVPVVAFFAIRWLPTAPRQALVVLALQVVAALAAMFPVWWFQWFRDRPHFDHAFRRAYPFVDPWCVSPARSDALRGKHRPNCHYRSSACAPLPTYLDRRSRTPAATDAPA